MKNFSGYASWQGSKTLESILLLFFPIVQIPLDDVVSVLRRQSSVYPYLFFRMSEEGFYAVGSPWHVLMIKEDKHVRQSPFKMSVRLFQIVMRI